jgi:hypothetical protein
VLGLGQVLRGILALKSGLDRALDDLLGILIFR